MIQKWVVKAEHLFSYLHLIGGMKEHADTCDVCHLIFYPQIVIFVTY